MKFYLFSLIIVFAVVFAFGQENNNSANLDFMYKEVIKLPSFKDQFNAKQKADFNQKVEDLKVNAASNTDYEIFMKLYSLIQPIRDSHLGLMSNPDSVLNESFKTEKLNPDSLLKAAINKPINSVEGLYFNQNYQYIIYRDEDYYKGVAIFDGIIYLQFMLYELTPNHFDLISFFKNGKIISLTRNVVYSNQYLVGTPFKKNNQKDFINVDVKEEKFQLSQIDNKTSYLRLGTFATTNVNVPIIKKFYAKVKDSINKNNLVVDLRNNGGGGFRASGEFLRLIKSYKGNVHLMVNCNTNSNAEQFVIRLMNKENVTIYGETTRGYIAYGNNRGTRPASPNNEFLFYITDMGAGKKDFELEYIGIKPDVILDPLSKDWVEQVIDKINGK